MDGIVTQTRSLATTLVAQVRTSDSTYLNNRVDTATIPGSQETTSFRSGYQDPNSISDADLQVFQPARYVVASGDTGHEFQTSSTRLLTTTKVNGATVYFNGYTIRYSGDAAIIGYAAPFAAPPVSPLTKSELSALGGRAISATIPTKPEAGLSQMLGELKRDGLPALPGWNTIYRPSASTLGGEHLNVVFGVQPLVQDIQKLARSVTHATEILRQFRRDSGRIVRRRFSFPEERSFVEWPVGSVNGANIHTFPFSISHLSNYGKLNVSDLTLTNVWFKGAYSYYLDVGDSLMAKAEEFEQKANHLLGTRLTPDVLYDLAPWSWLADWFGTVGTALSNVSALQEDGLVIRYGYLMRHTVTTRTVQAAPTLVGWDKPFPISSLYRTERKERWKATPYGFGLDLAGFTPRQWAIIAALGLSKAPGKMR